MNDRLEEQRKALDSKRLRINKSKTGYMEYGECVYVKMQEIELSEIGRLE